MLRPGRAEQLACLRPGGRRGFPQPSPPHQVSITLQQPQSPRAAPGQAHSLLQPPVPSPGTLLGQGCHRRHRQTDRQMSPGIPKRDRPLDAAGGTWQTPAPVSPTQPPRCVYAAPTHAGGLRGCWRPPQRLRGVRTTRTRSHAAQHPARVPSTLPTQGRGRSRGDGATGPWPDAGEQRSEKARTKPKPGDGSTGQRERERGGARSRSKQTAKPAGKGQRERERGARDVVRGGRRGGGGWTPKCCRRRE